MWESKYLHEDRLVMTPIPLRTSFVKLLPGAWLDAKDGTCVRLNRWTTIRTALSLVWYPLGNLIRTLLQAPSLMFMVENIKSERWMLRLHDIIKVWYLLRCLSRALLVTSTSLFKRKSYRSRAMNASFASHPRGLISSWTRYSIVHILLFIRPEEEWYANTHRWKIRKLRICVVWHPFGCPILLSYPDHTFLKRR